jgi:L-iditol 2-dehydrogenase
MRALSFDVTVSGFLRARTLGRWTEAATFGPLSNLRLREVPSPALRGPEWVRLQVLACGICGTDLANLTYSASPAMEPFGSFPAVPGHEILARVVEVGDGVRRVEVGQRVVVDPIISCRVRGRVGEGECLSCRAGHHGTCELAGEEGDPAGAPPGGEPLRRGLTIGYHADLPGGWGEEMIAHESQLFPVPSAIGDRAAVLVEPLSIGMRAVLNGGPAGPHEDVLVIGSGPIAMGAIWALRAAGFEGSIVAQTKRENEAQLARLMGADEVVKPGMEARQVLVETGALAYQPIVGDEVFSGGGFPVVFDCVGSAGSLSQALRFTAPRGRILMLGCSAELRKLDLTFLWARELEVKGFVGYGMDEWKGERVHTFQATLQSVEAGATPVERLVTHAFPLEQYRDALSAAANRRRSGALKVVLEP